MTTKPKSKARAVTIPQAKLIEELEGKKCQCGRKKVAGWPFCFRCRQRLPESVLERLSGSFDGEGLARYEVAYSEAVGLLRAKRKN